MRIEPLDDAEYLLVTTYRRDGTQVPTPVWFAGTNGRFVFVTAEASGKVRRIRNSSRVEVAVCDRKGVVLPGSARLAATARVLDDLDIEPAVSALRKKYGMKLKAFETGQQLWAKARKTEPDPQIAVEVVLNEAI